jgi:hypothetical protein
MSVITGINLKIFVTKNVDGLGNILSTGFTVTNTRELIVNKDSLGISQSIDNTFTSAANNISSTNNLQQLAGSTTSLGSVNFSCMLTSAEEPNDYWLWRALTSTYNAVDNWQNTVTYSQLNLTRTSNNIDVLGIIVVIDNLTYLLDNVRVEGINISLGLESFVTNNWACSFVRKRMLQGVILTKDENYTISNGLSGVFRSTNINSYKIAAAKPTRTNIYSYMGNTNYVVASTGTELQISNTLEYINLNDISSSESFSKFVGAKDFSLSGKLGVYAKTGEVYSLVSKIVNEQNSKNNLHLYTVTLQIMNGNSNVCDIVFDSCLFSENTEISTLITQNLDFQVTSSLYSQNCYIRFYK